MDPSLSKLIRATCRVSVDGVVKAAGWLIREDGLLLTAGEIADEADSGRVEVIFAGQSPRSARVVEHTVDRGSGIDFAILQMRDAYLGPTPISLSRADDEDDLLIPWMPEPPSFLKEELYPVEVERPGSYRPLIRLMGPPAEQLILPGSPLFSVKLGAAT